MQLYPIILVEKRVSIFKRLGFSLQFLIVFLCIGTPLIAQTDSAFTVHSSFILKASPTTAQCHASTLVQLKDSSIMVAWFAGSYEGASDVCIWSSTLLGTVWQPPVQLVCGGSPEKQEPCWNPVLALLTTDSLRLYYKIGPNPRQWRGMAMASNNQGKDWSTPIQLPDILGPIRNKPFITPKGTIIFPSSRETDTTWLVVMERSQDKGRTFQSIRVPAQGAVKAIQPVLLPLQNDGIFALCRSNQNVLMQTVSLDDGLTWSQLEPTQVANPNAGIEALCLKSGKYLLVYNPLQSGKEWYNGRNQLSLAISDDAYHWAYVGDIENQDSGEFSYPAAIQTPDGFVHITYTYNRKAIRYVKLEIH